MNTEDSVDYFALQERVKELEIKLKDSVEVVRCKYCKYGEKRIEDYRCWMLDEDWDIRFSPMHFCSYGERREERNK